MDPRTLTGLSDAKCGRLLVDVIQVMDRIIDRDGNTVTFEHTAPISFKEDPVPISFKEDPVPISSKEAAAPIYITTMDGPADPVSILNTDLITLKQLACRVKALQDALELAGIIIGK